MTDKIKEIEIPVSKVIVEVLCDECFAQEFDAVWAYEIKQTLEGEVISIVIDYEAHKKIHEISWECDDK